MHTYIVDRPLCIARGTVMNNSNWNTTSATVYSTKVQYVLVLPSLQTDYRLYTVQV